MPRTLADALRDAALLPLPVPGAITLRGLALEPDTPARADVVATFVLPDDRVVTSRQSVSLHATFLELPLDLDAAWRVGAALAALASEGPPEALADELEAGGARAVLEALLPPTPEDSLVEWFRVNGVAAMNGGTGDDAAIASVNLADGGRVTVVATAVDVSPRVEDFGQVKVTVQTRAFDAAGALRDVMEAECYSGAFEAADLHAPAPAAGADQPTARAWRAAWAARLATLAPSLEPGCAPHPIDVQSLPLAPLLSLWLREGPPGPRPERVRWDAASVARGARALRLLDEAELEDLRADDAFAAVGYALDGWQVLLTPGGRDAEKFWEERLTLRGPGGERVEVLKGDAWNPATRFVVGADAALFRGFATWLRAVVLEAGLDPEMVLVDEEDEEDEGDEDEDFEGGAGEDGDGAGGREPERVRVSEWLRFWDRDLERDGEPAVDWRVQGDMVAEATYLDGGPYGIGPEASAEVRRVGIPLYHRFVRDWIDPSFGGRGGAA